MLRDFIKVQKRKQKAETISIPDDLASSIGMFHNSPKLAKLPFHIFKEYDMNSLFS